MDLNIQKYLAFIKTVEYGSFTKAAEALSYSQSGISRMIHDLETEWHVSLLERGRAGVRLTSDGMKLLPHAQTICAEFEKLQTQVQALNGVQAGLIRIGTFSSVATHWLPNMIKAFQKDYPNIDYELLLGDYTEIENWLLAGRVDCGFLTLPTPSSLETIFLEQDQLLAILPTEHPLAQCDYFPTEAFNDAPFLLLDKGARAEVPALLAQYHLKPNIQCITWDDYAIMSMVESGLGISILPALILKRAPYCIVSKQLDVPAYRDIAFVLREQKSTSLAVKKFMEYLPYR